MQPAPALSDAPRFIGGYFDSSESLSPGLFDAAIFDLPTTVPGPSTLSGAWQPTCDMRFNGEQLLSRSDLLNPTDQLQRGLGAFADVRALLGEDRLPAGFVE